MACLQILPFCFFAGPEKHHFPPYSGNFVAKVLRTCFRWTGSNSAVCGQSTSAHQHFENEKGAFETFLSQCGGQAEFLCFVRLPTLRRRKGAARTVDGPMHRGRPRRRCRGLPVAGSPGLGIGCDSGRQIFNLHCKAAAPGVFAGRSAAAGTAEVLRSEAPASMKAALLPASGPP